MRISDWSSDLCSSYLSCVAPDQLAQEKRKMLTTQDWNAAAKLLLNSVESGTRELPTNSYEMPVSYYSDEDRWNREIEFIFKKKPIILALSCELADPNSYKTVKRIGLPILLTRDGDGKVRGFINACRHRGAILTGEVKKGGVAKRFTCPYHAWTFDNKGVLIALANSDQLGDVPDEYHRLIPIRLEEHTSERLSLMRITY